VGACFFSFGLLAVYLSSALFDAISEKMAKDLLHSFDLLSIYLLICGT
jgi:channel protein (hemolysin III family)